MDLLVTGRSRWLNPGRRGTRAWARKSAAGRLHRSVPVVAARVTPAAYCARDMAGEEDWLVTRAMPRRVGTGVRKRSFLSEVGADEPGPGGQCAGNCRPLGLAGLAFQRLPRARRAVLR